MAHIWQRHKSNTQRWAPVLLPGNCIAVLTGDPDDPITAGNNDCDGKKSAYIIRHSNIDGCENWILYISPQNRVSINGISIDMGIKSLHDRDEIKVGESGPLYFSTETLAQVEEFPGIGKTAQCPRCQQNIDVGDPAVRCPQCGVWHHQNEELNCWTYGPRCAACSEQDTELENTNFNWTPEEL